MSNAIRLAGDTMEAWRRNHEEAMECQDLEEYVSYGISLLRGLQEMDEEAAGKTGDPATMAAFGQLYQQWLAPTAALLSRLEDFKSRGYDVPVLHELRVACAEIKALLSIDTERLQRPFVPGRSVEDIRARVQPEF